MRCVLLLCMLEAVDGELYFGFRNFRWQFFSIQSKSGCWFRSEWLGNVNKKGIDLGREYVTVQGHPLAANSTFAHHTRLTVNGDKL